MQNKKIFNTFLESIEEQEIKSYAQLIQLLSGTDLEDTELLLKELQNLTFIEDEEVLYNKLPMAVYYKQLPVVLNSDILVKVVIMQQADGLILVVPENIVETYQDLVEDAELISEKNNGISLYAEIYNFEMSDPKLQDLIKATYVASGNELKAFDLKDKLAKEQKDKEAEEKPGKDRDLGGFDDLDSFDEISEEVADIPEVEVNEEAYRKFKKQSNALEKFVERLYNKANPVLREHVRVKNFKKVLVIEVDNKNIYEAYATKTAVAKQLLSNFGEAIRRNRNTQLVDSFSKDGKRFFILAENLANNYWYVINEDMDKLDDDKTYIEPNSRTVVKLRQSNIRKESRHIVPYKKGKKIVFVGGII